MIYTIQQKKSGTGSIHDLASDMFDRDIVFCPRLQVCSRPLKLLRRQGVHDAQNLCRGTRAEQTRPGL